MNPDKTDPVGPGHAGVADHTTQRGFSLEAFVSLERQALLIEGKYTFVASDYYGDCTKSALAVAVVALSQFSLLIFYVLGLEIGGAPDFSNGRVFSFYYAGWRSMYIRVRMNLVVVHHRRTRMYTYFANLRNKTRRVRVRVSVRVTRMNTHARVGTWSQPMSQPLYLTQAVPSKQ